MVLAEQSDCQTDDLSHHNADIAKPVKRRSMSDTILARLRIIGTPEHARFGLLPFKQLRIGVVFLSREERQLQTYWQLAAQVISPPQLSIAGLWGNFGKMI